MRCASTNPHELDEAEIVQQAAPPIPGVTHRPNPSSARTRLLAGVLCATALLGTQCRNKSGAYTRLAGPTQGTEYHITLRGESVRDYRTEIEEILREIDDSLSTYNPRSIITAVNNNDPDVVADRHLLNVVANALLVHRATDGAFDLTVAPLTKAYGFGPGERTEVSDEDIEALLPLVGMDKVTIDDGRLVKGRPEVTLDVDGIAQGYTVDTIGGFLEEEGITSTLR